MPRICDRSPCDTLMTALGVWVFGSNDGFYLVVTTSEEKDAEVVVDYCPFCGTRLEEVGAVAIEKYLRPRKRRRSRIGTA